MNNANTVNLKRALPPETVRRSKIVRVANPARKEFLKAIVLAMKTALVVSLVKTVHLKATVLVSKIVLAANLVRKEFLKAIVLAMKTALAVSLVKTAHLKAIVLVAKNVLASKSSPSSSPSKLRSAFGRP